MSGTSDYQKILITDSSFFEVKKESVKLKDNGIDYSFFVKDSDKPDISDTTVSFLANFTLLEIDKVTEENVEAFADTGKLHSCKVTTNKILDVSFSTVTKKNGGYLFTIRSGMFLFASNLFVVNSKLAGKLLNSAISGKLQGVEYDKMATTLRNNSEDHGIKNIASIAYEIMATELTVDVNTNEAIRLSSRTINPPLENIKTISIVSLSRKGGIVNALISENILSSLGVVLLKNIRGKTKNITPIERTTLLK